MATFGDSVERWRPLVDDYGCSMSTDFVLAFIEHESGGNWCSTGLLFSDGSSRECGIGQLDFGDHPSGTVFGADRATLRTGCSGQRPTVSFADLGDDTKQQNVSSACDQIDHFANTSRSQLDDIGADWNGVDFGRLVKMQHNLPALPSLLLRKYTSENGRPPQTWDEWRAWVEGLDSDELGPTLRAFAPLGRLFDNAEAVADRAGLTSDSPTTGAGIVGGDFLVPALFLFYALTRGAS